MEHFEEDNDSTMEIEYEESEEYEDEEEEEEEETLFFENISDKEQDEIIETIYEVTEEIVKKDISRYSNPQFLSMILKEITGILLDNLTQASICEGTDIDELKVANFVEYNVLNWFQQNGDIYPLRQEPHMDFNIYECVFGLDEDFILEHNAKLISELQEKNKKIPAQRTPEWYKTRHNMITASNLYQIFGSDALKNRLIYEKCQPIVISTVEPTYINTELSTHWGVKYEPVSTALYEEIIDTTVEAFGCLTHTKYPFIGASPDGIITDPESPYFARMLEIKNIVNREIDGIPSEAYWIQMQIQMEVCGLEACDFLETRFKEYENEEAFYNELNNIESTDEKKRGVILYFVKRGEQVPNYQYMPLSNALDKDSIDQWIKEQQEIHINQEIPKFLFKTIYWYLEEYSLITVRKNQAWFDSVISQITEFWDVIEKERVNGYEHRAPKSRIRGNSEIEQKIHIVKLDETQIE
jgi:putative phage-type endonuclease